MQHIIYSHFCMYNSKIEAISQSDPMQVNDREGSGKPRVTSGQISELVFSNAKCVFLNHFDIRILKCHFYFCARYRNAQNYGWKVTPSTDTFFGLCVCQKEYINLTFSMPDVLVQVYNIYSAFKIFRFYYFGDEKSFPGQSQVAILNSSSFYVLWCFSFVFFPYFFLIF